MNKYLINSEAEYIALFESYDLEDAEEFLDVEFAMLDGSYYSDVGDTDLDGKIAALGVSKSVYRKRSEEQFPEEYPCVVLLENSKTFDRTGNVHFKHLSFIYLSDFQR